MDSKAMEIAMILLPPSLFFVVVAWLEIKKIRSGGFVPSQTLVIVKRIMLLTGIALCAYSAYTFKTSHNINGDFLVVPFLGVFFIALAPFVPFFEMGSIDSRPERYSIMGPGYWRIRFIATAIGFFLILLFFFLIERYY
jgi:hypothetical protein